MKLHPAGPETVGLLAELHATAFDAPWTPAAILEVLEGPGAFGLFAVDEHPLGMILARAVAGEAEILTVAVSPRARRRGVGRALVDAVALLARQAGAEDLFLEVAVDNAAAIALYESRGFSHAGVRKGYYNREGAPAADAAVLRLDLNTSPA